MDLTEWFRRQLEASGEGMIWAVQQVPEARRYRRPPPALGTWSAVRHLFHLVHYERHLALPNMRLWLGESLPLGLGPDEEAAWRRAPELTRLIDVFREVRAEQIACLDRLSPSAWEEVRWTVWGHQSLRWVVTKTYQHTAEHTHDVLQLALFWDMVA